ncbi:MAG: sigma-70 family RNA polymerase sigma factor [Lacipirellulaceae bacterium]
MASEQTDHELLRAVASGDSAAARSLFDRFAPVLLAIGGRVLRRPDDAEQVVNDVFFELFRRPESYAADRGPLGAYLAMLTRSRSIDALRRRSSGVSAGSQSLSDASKEVPSSATGPSELAEASELRATVGRALAELSPDERQAIDLAFYSGLSHTEIAAQTNLPLGTVKGRLRRALIRLRDVLRTLHGGAEQ